MEMSSSHADHLGGVVSLGDLPVRRLGFGAARILWSAGPDPRRGGIELLRQVVDAGVTLIDTADCYDDGPVEETIAAALYPYPDGLVVASKGGVIMGPGWSNGVHAPRDGRPEALRAACEGSLRRLRTDCLDVYQLHTPDPAVPFEASVGALVDLQREGKVRHIGLSNVGRTELFTALGMAEIVSVQNRFNLDSRSSARVLAECERLGIPFIAYEPSHVTETPVRREVATRLAATVRQLAIAWTLRCSPAVCPIPGTSSQEHAAQNIAAAGLALTDDDLERLAAEAPSSSERE